MKLDALQLYQFAFYLATAAHDGQTDKAGQDYIEHPIRVAKSLENEGLDTQTVAMLHDVLEDTWVNEPMLRRLFPKEIADSVVRLTRESSKSYDDYIEQIATSGDTIAMKVKIADLKDNMNLGRLSEITEKDLERVKKYARSKKRLEEALEKEQMAF